MKKTICLLLVFFVGCSSPGYKEFYDINKRQEVTEKNLQTVAQVMNSQNERIKKLESKEELVKETKEKVEIKSEQTKK